MMLVSGARTIQLVGGRHGFAVATACASANVNASSLNSKNATPLHLLAQYATFRAVLIHHCHELLK